MFFFFHSGRWYTKIKSKIVRIIRPLYGDGFCFLNFFLRLYACIPIGACSRKKSGGRTGLPSVHHRRRRRTLYTKTCVTNDGDNVALNSIRKKTTGTWNERGHLANCTRRHYTTSSSSGGELYSVYTHNAEILKRVYRAENEYAAEWRGRGIVFISRTLRIYTNLYWSSNYKLQNM